MGTYVKHGYVSRGYVAGVSVLPEDIGDSTKIKFFISKGDMGEDELKAEIANSIDEDTVAILYAPETSKIMLGGVNGFVSFLGSSGGSNKAIAALREELQTTKEELIDLRRWVSSISTEMAKRNLVAAKIMAHDGSVIANASINKLGNDEFDITIPDSLVGTHYKIRICADAACT